MDEQYIAQQQAQILIERAYREQMNGNLGDAIQLYRRSDMFPTASPRLPRLGIQHDGSL
ncbi:MAG: hypothetical protein R3C44_07935 [Chloroflexota bacterium]